MKKIFTILLLSSKLASFSQNGAPANPYYNGFNWNQSGNSLKTALATKITTTHTKLLTYNQTENALKIIDRDPNDAINVFLVYGFSSNICTYTNVAGVESYGTYSNWNEHRKRHKEADQPAAVAPNPAITQCVWNREHVFAKSLGTPNLTDTSPDAGTDAHHIRTSDVDRNALRGSKKFASGSGNSAIVGSDWYPGDEWKGDVARMMMYMYLRYPTQCKPISVGTGAPVSTDTNMIQLFLQWNAEDPVSQYEDIRNNYLGNALNTNGQGNRNPFIDNPYLATLIWGGQVAQNRWPAIYLGTNTFDYENSVSIYPNPTSNDNVNISSTLEWKEIKIM
jgi:endonuclease I